MPGVFVTVTIPVELDIEFKEILMNDVKESRNEAGCLRFDLLSQPGGIYNFYEVRHDRAGLKHRTDKAKKPTTDQH